MPGGVRAHRRRRKDNTDNVDDADAERAALHSPTVQHIPHAHPLRCPPPQPPTAPPPTRASPTTSRPSHHAHSASGFCVRSGPRTCRRGLIAPRSHAATTWKAVRVNTLCTGAGTGSRAASYLPRRRRWRRWMGARAVRWDRMERTPTYSEHAPHFRVIPRAAHASHPTASDAKTPRSLNKRAKRHLRHRMSRSRSRCTPWHCALGRQRHPPPTRELTPTTPRPCVRVERLRG